MSEWLGTGLQNRLHQFESGWNLEARVLSKEDPLYFAHCQHFTYLRHGDSLQKIGPKTVPGYLFGCQGFGLRVKF